ncbi:MAG TPA: hypothetical protein VI542_01015 [Candidatus Tectomicrobia bacterium]
MTPDRDDPFPGRLRARRASAPLPSASQDELATLLPDHVSHNMGAITTLHLRADETVSALFGRPAFFSGIMRCEP